MIENYASETMIILLTKNPFPYQILQCTELVLRRSISNWSIVISKHVFIM